MKNYTNFSFEILHSNRHIRLTHRGFKDKTREQKIVHVGEYAGENHTIFANKMSNSIGFLHPISVFLDRFIEDSNAFEDEIRNSINVVKRLLSDIEDESTTDCIVYFRLSKDRIVDMKLRNKQFNLKRFLIALTYGYFGETNYVIARRKGHRASDDSHIVIEVKVLEFKSFNELIETLLIKLINVDNFKTNRKNGTNFFISGLDHRGHIMIALFYLKIAFEKAFEIYQSFRSIDDNVDIDTGEEYSSQSTCYTFSQQSQFLLASQHLEETIELVDISDLKPGLDNISLIGTCTSRGPLTRFSNSDDQFFMFDLSDQQSMIRVQCTDGAEKLLTSIEVGRKYLLKGVGVVIYNASNGRGQKIKITDSEKVVKLAEQVKINGSY